MKQNVLLMPGCKVIATDDGSLGTQRILAFTLIGIVILIIEYLAGDAKLIKELCLPLLSQ